MLLFPQFNSSILNAQLIKAATNGIRPKEVKNLDEFKRLAVLDEGRVKPLETFARKVLLQLSGKTTFNKKPAMFWVTRLLFAPEATLDDKVILINSPDIPMALGLTPVSHRRYSFADIQPHYEKLQELAIKSSDIEQKSRSIVEQELIRVEAAVRLYAGLAQSFKFAMPHDDFEIDNVQVLRLLQIDNRQKQFSFIDVALRADRLKNFTDLLLQKDQSTWNATDKDVLDLISRLYEWSTHYQGLPLLLIPSYAASQEGWLSPWEAIAQGLSLEVGRVEASLLREMTIAYWNGEQVSFDVATKNLRQQIKQRAHQLTQKSLKKFDLELFYNKANLFFWAQFCYALIFILFILNQWQAKSFFYQKACWLMWTGFLLHGGAIVLRILIMSRPPVTNLYETFIFVGWVGVLVGVILEKINRQGLGMVVVSVCGFILLTIASKFSADGDTLKMLVAVLNSNFWLGTHVITITIGYAGVCVAGVLGHVYLLQQVLGSKVEEALKKTHQYLWGVLMFGLMMTFLGTNLGGIWADQSWGRFWGWDPKENGAMLIVLWCAILFHAKIGRMIGPLGVAVGSVLGLMVVIWAWFGVNLLSVGLHSYGFSSGAMTGLLIYVILQLLFLVGIVWRIKTRKPILP